jgi:hypothetical protein
LKSWILLVHGMKLQNTDHKKSNEINESRG